MPDHERHNMMRVKTEITEDGCGVMQVRDMLGSVTTHYLRLCEEQMESRLREALVGMGWTPPPDRRHDTISSAASRLLSPTEMRLLQEYILAFIRDVSGKADFANTTLMADIIDKAAVARNLMAKIAACAMSGGAVLRGLPE